MNQVSNPRSDSRLAAGFAFAEQLHAGQVRKSTDIPYLSHLMAVAALVQENGGDGDQVIAALLHDGPEDRGGRETLEAIRGRFGDRVAAIVEGCTDTFDTPKPPWRPRKLGYLEHLRSADADTLLVSLADKVHNLSCIVQDYRNEGERLWDRFNADRENILWYYRELLAAYTSSSQPLPERLIGEFERLLQELLRLLSQ